MPRTPAAPLHEARAPSGGNCASTAGCPLLPDDFSCDSHHPASVSARPGSAGTIDTGAPSALARSGYESDASFDVMRNACNTSHDGYVSRYSRRSRQEWLNEMVAVRSSCIWSGAERGEPREDAPHRFVDPVGGLLQRVRDRWRARRRAAPGPRPPTEKRGPLRGRRRTRQAGRRSRTAGGRTRAGGQVGRGRRRWSALRRVRG